VGRGIGILGINGADDAFSFLPLLLLAAAVAAAAEAGGGDFSRGIVKTAALGFN